MAQAGWLKFLARLVYGIILPLYLLHLAFSAHFAVEHDRAIETWREKMDASLDAVSKFNSDDVFFHGLLQENFRHAARQADVFAAVKQRIASLKKAFSGNLKFVLWDKNGRVLPDLSDEKRFQYVMRALHQAVLALREHIAEFAYPMPELVADVTSRIRLLRGYFGQFLMEKHMVLPLADSYLGGCIRASEETEKGLLWFQIFEEFGVVCMISHAQLNRHAGPKLLIDRHNGKGGEVKLGFYNTQSRIIHGIDSSEHKIEPLMIEAEAYLRSAVEFRKTSDFLMLFRQVSPEIVVFSILPIAGNVPDVDFEARKSLWRVVKWLLVGAFTLYCFGLRGLSVALSVRQKMLLLFLFANGLPLLILAASGYEFFEQKKQSLIHQTHENSSRIIKEFDNLFPSGRDNFAVLLRRKVGELNSEFGAKAWPHEKIMELKELVAGLNPSESYLFNVHGDQVFGVGREASTNSIKFMRDFFQGTLEFFNNARPVILRKSSKNMLEKISDESSVYYGVIHQLERIGQQNYGSGMRWTYLDLLGDRINHNSWGFLLVSWRPGDLQREFLNKQLEEINLRIAPRKLIVMEKGSEKILPAAFSGYSTVRRIMHKTQTRKIVTENNLVLDNTSYIATSLTGIELSDAVIMAIYPRDEALKEIAGIFYRLMAAALLSLVVVLVIVLFFSRRLLLPLSGLSDGIQAISGRDYKYRIPIDTDDEFGQLVKAFNETMHGMEDLAVGTAVQTSLLPPSHAESGRCRLFARSIFMSKMGGDYYDYFNPDKNRMAIFFGDVAGHGIPAALIMAMAKGMITSLRNSFAGPSELLKKVNSVLVHIKEKGLRRMMTGLCVEIDCNSGQFKVANAGQCYPVIINCNTGSIRYIKAVGMPMGNVSKKPYAEVADSLLPGEILILYSDGIIEATNINGEVFDFSRFEQLLKDCCDKNLEQFWNGIYRGYTAWTAEQDDDITFLMVCHE